ncbi:hypothetical protein L1887_21799 [Cichorium endivia]|nr:hypothetical protein L1887_21799 [Cichorium endivia]
MDSSANDLEPEPDSESEPEQMITIVNLFKQCGSDVWKIFGELALILSVCALILQATLEILKQPKWIQGVCDVITLVALTYVAILGSIEYFQ